MSNVKVYPQGNQAARPGDIEITRTGTDLFETIDVTTNTSRKFGSINNLLEREVVHLAAATQALTAAQCGDRFVGAADAVFTLPAAAAGTKGLWYIIESCASAGSVGVSISPAAADHIWGCSLTHVANKDLICTFGTARVGDMVRIYCDGVTGWMIDKIIGTWAKEL